MKKFGRRIMAMALAGAMMCAPMTAFADEASSLSNTGTMSGSGAVEGAVKKDIYKVVLPTSAEASATMDFIADPQSLITGTDAAKYANKSFEPDATVYFANADGSEYNYSSTSDDVTILNKGTLPVKVTLKAKVSSLTSTADSTKAIKMDQAGTFATPTDTSVYIGMSVNGATAVGLTETEETVASSINLAAAPEEAYETTYSTDGGYAYVLKSDVDDSMFDSLSFNLTGKANPSLTADWTTVTDVVPSIGITWSLEAGAAPTGTTPTFASENACVITWTDGSTDSDSNNTIDTWGDLDLKSIDSIVAFDYDLTETIANAWDAAVIDYNAKTVTISDTVSKAFGNIATADAVITYTNKAGKTKTANVTIKLK